MHRSSAIRLNTKGWLVLSGLIVVAGMSYAIQMTKAQDQLNDLKSEIKSLPIVPGSFLEKEFSSPKPEYLLVERTYSTQASSQLVKTHYQTEFNKRGYLFVNDRSGTTNGAFSLYYCSQSFDIEIGYEPTQTRTATYAVLLIIKSGLEISLAKGIKLGSGCSTAK